MFKAFSFSSLNIEADPVRQNLLEIRSKVQCVKYPFEFQADIFPKYYFVIPATKFG